MFRKPQTWPQEYKVQTKNGEVSIQIRHSKRAKRLRLKATTSGIQLVVPHRTKPELAENFLNSSANWIADSNHRVQARQALYDPTTIHFNGIPTPILPSTLNKVEFHQSHILAPGDTPQKRRENVEKTLRKQARITLENRSQHFSQIMGLQFLKLRIADQKTRWGSCSSRGTLSFTWRLLMAPKEVLDYIVIHELAHLKHMNHSPGFWAFVEAHCPTYKEQEKWLNKYGPALMQRGPNSTD